MKIFGLLGLVFLFAACSTFQTESPSLPQNATNIEVAPEFLTFYKQHGGVRILGFPISSAYEDPDSGRIMQYFQHFRLEYDQSGEIISASPLGEFYAPPEQEQVPAPQQPNVVGRTFPETGFSVQGAFLTFFDENGGQDLFGLPITPQFDEGGKLVQYFQNALLVWNPNALPEYRIEIAGLADSYYWQFGGPETDSFRQTESAAVTAADVQALVKEPVLYAGEEQVLYVTVVTPDSLRFVEGAAVNATITYNGSSTKLDFVQRTDEYGHVQQALDLSGIEPGQTVMLEIQASNGSDETRVIGSTTLNFKTWW